MRKLKGYIRLPFIMRYLNKRIRSDIPITTKLQSLQFSDLALDIATVSNLHTKFPALLSPIQEHLNLLFSTKENCQIHLVISNKSKPFTPDIISANQSVSNTVFTNQLSYFFSRQDHQQNEKNSFSLPGFHHHFYSQALSLKGDHNAYFVLSFSDQTPQQTYIQHHTSPILHSISRGLCAFFSQQDLIQQAISMERSTQAAELHDSMAQVLGYLRLKTSQLVSHCQKSDDDELQALSTDIAYQTHSAYRSARELISTSRLPTQNKSLSHVIREAITEFEQQSNVVFELDNRILHDKQTNEQEAQLQFIVREALSNIVRHSHATHARIQLNSDEKSLTITIEDNGNGIKKENKRHDSFGLSIMEERARKIGAHFDVKGRHPHGTRIEITYLHSKKSQLNTPQYKEVQ
ncbi:MAG: sensor histidine kinase [Marinomonas colpomeniae]